MKITIEQTDKPTLEFKNLRELEDWLGTSEELRKLQDEQKQRAKEDWNVACSIMALR